MKTPPAPTLGALVALTTLLLTSPTTSAQNTWLYSATGCAQKLPAGDDLAQIGGAFADCMLDDAVRIGADAAFDLLDAEGKRRFGPGFAVTSRLHLHMDSHDKVLGDIDLVLPLGASATRHDASPTRAWFMQHGITRWNDAHGEVRNDARFGGAYRFAHGGNRSGVYGISALLQQNREYGHERMVAGLDYTGVWGNGSLSWYRPLTDWLPGRPGYEERALEGVNFALNLNLTTSVDMHAGVSRWQRSIGSDATYTQSSFGLDWRPHEWLAFGADWRDAGADSTAAYRAKLEIPLGGARKPKPRWIGFGVVGDAVAQPVNIYRGLTHATRIEYAERTTQTVPVGRIIDGVTVRFMQSSAPSGGDVRLEIILPAAVDVDTPVVVQLEPGDGDNPAAPGVDYADEPVTAIIRAGETSAIVTIRLLTNYGISSARSLSVAVRAA